jgi:hypothetical protein
VRVSFSFGGETPADEHVRWAGERHPERGHYLFVWGLAVSRVGDYRVRVTLPGGRALIEATGDSQ